jgi:endonuclease III
MKGVSGLPRDYRDLVGFVGAGPKVALFTLQEATGSVQGVPCDVHMCRIFAKLGWIPATIEADAVVSFISHNMERLSTY